ncbi:MAG: hypothetical protein GY749_39940 [Desulfobacteraceae bacterium]|nr:hypothetical protein [Desulfobacteraceae bacterium]
MVPFYFEIRETDQWIGDFAREFFLTFIYQYIAFHSRNPDYLSDTLTKTFSNASEISEKEGFGKVTAITGGIHTLAETESADTLWNAVRDIPRGLAHDNDERVVQMIDEFQFINRFIFWDREKKRRAANLAGSYLHTCEYKSAPMLVTGSWVGWLMDDLNHFLPGRFLKDPLGNLSEDESVEMIYKYSHIDKVPVTEETVWLMTRLTEGNPFYCTVLLGGIIPSVLLMTRLTEGNPFYISALFRSKYPGKDLTTEEGVRKTLEFETLNTDASINAAWMEYLDSAFSRINDVHAKDMVLFLSKNRHRYVTRKEMKKKLNLDITDTELEKKFRALHRADIIEEEYGRYRGFGTIFLTRCSGGLTQMT